MINLYIILLIIVVEISSTSSNNSVYDAKILEITVGFSEWESMQNDENYDMDIISFSRISGESWSVVCRVDSEMIDILKESKITYKVLVDNMRSYTANINSQIRKGPDAYIYGEVTFKNYLTFEEIVDYVNTKPAYSKPWRLAAFRRIGKSVEKRDIVMLEIRHAQSIGAVVIDGGMHGREWLSVMTAVYVIEAVMTSTFKSSYRKLDWYIIPVLNPDGFYYSREKERYLFHAKNLNVNECLLVKKSRCAKEYCGVNLNRNFAFHNVAARRSIHPCFYNYGGKHNFSEPESKALRDVLVEHKDRLVLYISLHSSGSLILYPWGYKKQKCDDWEELERIGSVAVKAVAARSNKTIYQVGTATGFAAIAGCSIDFAKHIGIKYSYDMLLHPAGVEGIIPDIGLIKKYVGESFQGIAAIVSQIAGNETGKVRSGVAKFNNVRNNQIIIKASVLYIQISLLCLIKLK